MKAGPELTGQRFSRLLVLERVEDYWTPRGFRHRRYRCLCDCGAEAIAFGGALRSGKSKSCGCLNKSGDAHVKHGGVRNGDPEYTVWCGMVSRCHNEKATNYGNYGARGIVVCDRWKSSYAAFIGDMGRRPSEKHSLDRYPDNDGNYEPGNCRWATRNQQARNTSRNVIITAHGRSMCVADWAIETGQSREKIRSRLRRGWTHERAVAP